MLRLAAVGSWISGRCVWVSGYFFVRLELGEKYCIFIIIFF